MKSGIGFVGVVVVALANVATTWAQSDESPRRLREGTRRTLVDEGFPSAAGAFEAEKEITASDGATTDQFGRSVAISGDTAIVGAGPQYPPLIGAGAAYVYQRHNAGANNWGEVAKMTINEGAINDGFGFSVAISGDTAIVGALIDDGDGTKGAGSAYVYRRHEGGVDNWGQVTKITASDAETNDNFGVSVALSGDTAIVGARSSDGGNGSQSGSAYVFRKDEGGADNWGEVTKISASDGVVDAAFGFSVAINGDTAIVGAPFDDDYGSASGSAYVYQRDEGGTDNWGEVTKITASDAAEAEPLEQFGQSVALSGDTAIVGAFGKDHHGSFPSSAYVYHRDAGGADNWGEVTKINASDGTIDDRFGISVAISGDTAIVGAPWDEDNGELSGSAYVYQRDEGGADNWGEVIKITPSDGNPFDRFGFSVAISGDTAIVGAFGDDDNNGPGYGSAYVLEPRPEPVVVPTGAEWGIVGMTLLLAAMTIRFGGRRRVTR